MRSQTVIVLVGSLVYFVAGARAAERQSGPYALALSAEGVTVCWQTAKPERGTVQYALAGSEKWMETAPTPPTRFHAVRLTDLRPGSEYRAKVLLGGIEAGALSFCTVPRQAERFTFFVYGDTRSYPEDHARVVRALLSVVARTGAHTFVVHTGDFAMYGSDERETAEQFFRPAAPLLARLPLVPTRGNHECGTELFDRYFPVPEPPPASGGARDFCFDYGTVRLVVLDQYAHAEAAPRLKWLADRLAEAQDRWRLVAFHAPLYSSGLHGPDLEWRALLEPILRSGRVHAVFCGHDHNYERTRPIGGVTYLTTGGGGAPLRGMGWGDRPEWSAKFESVPHFLTVVVSPEKLIVSAFRVDETKDEPELFDAVQIPRETNWSPAVAPELKPGEHPLLAEGRQESRWRTAHWLAAALAGLLCGILLVAWCARRRRSGTS